MTKTLLTSFVLTCAVMNFAGVQNARAELADMAEPEMTIDAPAMKMEGSDMTMGQPTGGTMTRPDSLKLERQVKDLCNQRPPVNERGDTYLKKLDEVCEALGCSGYSGC